jgi:hypothetical protein
MCSRLRVNIVGKAVGLPNAQFHRKFFGDSCRKAERPAEGGPLPCVASSFPDTDAGAGGSVAADAAPALMAARAAAGVHAGGAGLAGFAGGRAALDTQTRRCLAGYPGTVGPAGAAGTYHRGQSPDADAP